MALSAILMNLLEQQKSRRDQLLETINSIEQQRCITVSIGLYAIVFLTIISIKLLFYLLRILEDKVNFG